MEMSVIIHDWLSLGMNAVGLQVRALYSVETELLTSMKNETTVT